MRSYRAIIERFIQEFGDGPVKQVTPEQILTYPQLKWDNSQAELEGKHVLFMTDERDLYIDKLLQN